MANGGRVGTGVNIPIGEVSKGVIGRIASLLLMDRATLLRTSRVFALLAKAALKSPSMHHALYVQKKGVLIQASNATLNLFKD